MTGVETREIDKMADSVLHRSLDVEGFNFQSHVADSNTEM